MQETAAAIMSPAKGMLVADEYAEALVSGGVEDRDRVQRFAEMILRTRDLDDSLSAILLTERTFAATSALRGDAGTADARPLFGVRMAAPDLSSRGRLASLLGDGASFVEWRANLSPPEVPRGAAHIRAGALAEAAAAAQAEGLLPVLTIAMPDLAASSIGVNQAVTTNALLALRDQLEHVGVDARRLVVRVNMVVPGPLHPKPADPDQVARLTIGVLENGVPEGSPGVLLLSGGQPLEQACANLRAVASLAAARRTPWRVTFGFSRPLITAAAAALVRAENDAEAHQLLVQDCRRASESLVDELVPGKEAS
jgi:fructose-bisphosphate aldolase class I